MLAEHELCDGCVLGERIRFRIPLRGLASPYLSPTKINVFNKFSVKYFVQVKIILSRPVHDAALDREEDDQDSGADDN